MKKYILLFAILISGVAQAQVNSSSVDFSNKKERKALNKKAKQQEKANRSKLIVILNEDFDDTKSLTIEASALKAKDRQIVEDAFYSNGFTVIDRSTKKDAVKLSRKERKTQELKKELGIEDEKEDFELSRGVEYQSTYVLRFGAKSRLAGKIAKSLILPTDFNDLNVFGMQIIDLNQGGKVIARASYRGKKVDKTVFYGALAKELRRQVDNQ